jgi:hypothetical protein
VGNIHTVGVLQLCPGCVVRVSGPSASRNLDPVRRHRDWAARSAVSTKSEDARSPRKSA